MIRRVVAGLDLARVGALDLDRAARQVVRTSLAVRRGERVAIVADARGVRVADALVRAVHAAEAEPRIGWLEAEGGRPLTALPPAIAALFDGAAASVFVGSAAPDELAMRQAILALVTERRLRHAHMPGVSALAFCRGLRVDYDVVAGYGVRLLSKLARATRVLTTSEAGTLLLVKGAPKWLPQLGQLEPGRWGNLPAGALYATPATVEGTFVADASVAGRPDAPPVTLHLRESCVVGVEVPDDRTLEASLKRRFSEPNADRVGLVAIGVNYGLEEPTGEALVDQNLPGLHLSIGDPAVGATGERWRAPSSIAFCQARATVQLDGEAVVRDGRLVEPS